MTSMMTRSLILFFFWASMAQCNSEDLKTSFTDLLTFLNGDYDNFDDPAAGETMDRIRIIFKPVSIPGLQKDQVLYIEESLNGKVYNRWLTVRNESSTGRNLYATYYNFKNSGNYEPGTFNTDDLVNLTLKDLNGACPVFNQRESQNIFISDWSDCKHDINGQHPSYYCTFTCTDFIFGSPVPSDEVSALAPYRLVRRGPRFPLIGAPEGYIIPCQDGE